MFFDFAISPLIKWVKDYPSKSTKRTQLFHESQHGQSATEDENKVTEDDVAVPLEYVTSCILRHVEIPLSRSTWYGGKVIVQGWYLASTTRHIFTLLMRQGWNLVTCRCQQTGWTFSLDGFSSLEKILSKEEVTRTVSFLRSVITTSNQMATEAKRPVFQQTRLQRAKRRQRRTGWCPWSLLFSDRYTVTAFCHTY